MPPHPLNETPVPRAPMLPARNYFRYEEILPGVIFVSVDSGDWTFLSEAEFRMLRESRLGDDLRRKLERCFVLLTEENIDAYCRRLAARYFFLTEGPTLHILVVTRECNLSCIYCQASSRLGRAEKMDIETARMAVDRALETPARSLILEFQGGEPLLNFPAVQVAILHAEARAAVLGKEVNISLISNFTEVVTEDALRFLLDHRVSVCFSLDGPAALHDHSRNRDGCFDQVKANIALFKRVWSTLRTEPPVVRALLTTTRPSLGHAIDIVETYATFGIDMLSIRPLTPIGRARGTRCDLQYSGDEFLTFWKEVVAEVLRRREKGMLLVESHLELFLQKLFSNETGHMDIRSPCGAGIGQIVYDVDGSIYTCDEGRMLASDRFCIGHVNAPLKEALASSRMRAVLEASIAEQYFCDTCAMKPFCGVCPVLQYVEEGDEVGNPLAQRRCAVYGGMLRHILRQYATDGNVRQMFGDIVAASW